MQKSQIAVAGMLIYAGFATAANLPCSGSKGGIAYCDGPKFICNDGSYSASTKDCSATFVPSCTLPKIAVNGTCVIPPTSCISPQVLIDGACVTPPPTCIAPQVLKNGTCVTPAPTCTAPQVLTNGVCVTPPPTCNAPQILENGACVTPPPICIAPQVLENGACVTPSPICVPPQVLTDGACITPSPVCTAPQVLENGSCVTPPPTCIAPQVLTNGVCVTPPPTCTAPQVFENGICTTPEIEDPAANLLKIEHDDYTLWLDCEKRGAVKFQYDTRPDTGKAKRISKFYPDPDVPAECQQLSTKTYGKNFERGHLIPANHLDYSDAAIYSSNYITNILPQTKTLNRGAWLATEDIIECYRDLKEMTVIGGALYSNPANDYFLKSHGVETPEWFWKVVIDHTTPDVIAWMTPNTNDATRKRLDFYLIDVYSLEKITGQPIPISTEMKYRQPDTSWKLPKKCNLQ